MAMSRLRKIGGLVLVLPSLKMEELTVAAEANNDEEEEEGGEAEEEEVLVGMISVVELKAVNVCAIFNVFGVADVRSEDDPGRPCLSAVGSFNASRATVAAEKKGEGE